MNRFKTIFRPTIVNVQFLLHEKQLIVIFELNYCFTPKIKSIKRLHGYLVMIKRPFLSTTPWPKYRLKNQTRYNKVIQFLLNFEFCPFFRQIGSVKSKRFFFVNMLPLIIHLKQSIVMQVSAIRVELQYPPQFFYFFILF